MKCVICDKEIEKSKYGNAILCSQECFIVDFWNYYVKTKDNPSYIRIAHSHYVIGEESKQPNRFRGFGGATFNIKHNDGRFISTTNLWNQGEIPEQYWEQLPDNAIFCKTAPEVAAEKLLDNLFNKDNEETTCDTP